MEPTKPKKISSLKNHFLLAMPGLTDPNFADSVIYICEHNADGAMGLIINHQMDIPVKAIFEQLDVEYQDEFARPCSSMAARFSVTAGLFFTPAAIDSGSQHGYFR